MPELPEVETICRGLARVLIGQRLDQVVVVRSDLRLPVPADFVSKTVGRIVKKVERRAKYLLIELDDGTVILGHLGMSGRLFVKAPPLPALMPHDHVVFETSSPQNGPLRLVYHDPRRFGLLVLGHTGTLFTHELLRELGPEPLAPQFGAPQLAGRLAARPKTPLKAALLDQRVVAGLGNIYVSEALHRAGLSPERAAVTLLDKPGRAAIARLARAIRQVLQDAVAAGGSTLRDYVQANGEVGSFQNRFRVYDRDGQPCPRRGCRGTVERIVQSGRATYFCAMCQR